ncbi:MAG: EamA family transporter, partial [Paracoccaceae bacterium]|nr:EamA family transporter [Paracoccaceae bacterium]
LTPVLAVGFGWLILDEQVGPAVLIGLVLVAAGIVLINRRPRVPA